MAEYRISQLADRVGVPASTLRFYEQQGLLPAERSPSGYRLYDLQSVERLGFIAAAKHLGLPLTQIRELLGVWESGLCVQVQDRLRPMLQDSVQAAAARSAELAVFTGRLQQALTRLDGPSRAGRCDPSCDFLLRPPATEGFDGSEGSPVPVEVVGAGPIGATRSPRSPADGPSGDGPLVGSSDAVAPSDPVVVELACSSTPAGKGEQVQRWSQLVAEAVAVTRFGGGFRVRLPIGRLSTAADVAAAEQACCPFFDIRLVLAGPVFDLEVRAPEQAAVLLDELLGGPV